MNLKTIKTNFGKAIFLDSRSESGMTVLCGLKKLIKIVILSALFVFSGSSAHALEGEFDSYELMMKPTISTSSDMTCFVTLDGDVKCKGRNISNVKESYGINDAVSVSVGGGHVCILKDNGNVDCDGNNYNGQVVDYDGGDAIQVATSSFHTCIVKNNGNVDCEGKSSRYYYDNQWWKDSNQNADYNGGDAIGVSVTPYTTCILKDNGNVHCYGSEGYRGSWSHLAEGYNGGDAVGIKNNWSGFCVLRENGKIVCKGMAIETGLTEYRYHGGDAVGFGMMANGICVLKNNGNSECTTRETSNDNYRSSNTNYESGDAVGLSYTGLFACYIKSDGSASCNGPKALTAYAPNIFVLAKGSVKTDSLFLPTVSQQGSNIDSESLLEMIKNLFFDVLNVGDINLKGQILKNGKPLSFSTMTETGGNIIKSKGNIGIGTTDPRTDLDVEGDVSISGNLVLNSDISAEGNLNIEGKIDIGGPLSSSGVQVFSILEDGAICLGKCE